MALASDPAALYATAIFQQPGEVSPHVDGVSAYSATLHRTQGSRKLGLVVAEPKPPMSSTFCVARLLSTSRGDATVANQVIKDIRRWIAHCHSSVQMIRRTVATTVVALPADLRCLDVVVKGLGSSSAGLQYHWGTTSLLAKWFQQITSDVANLHSTLRISHLSLGPCSVFLDPGTNEMQMGDFLGKVQFQRNAQSGFSTKDDEWAMWYPAEVQKRIAQEGNLVPGSSKKREDAEIMDEYAVDAWQLGVLAFFLLTGEHPFGASNQPTVVCGNITTHRVAHWNLLEDFPLWADLIGRLLSHDPADRLKVSEVVKGPREVLTDLQELQRKMQGEYQTPINWVASAICQSRIRLPSRRHHLGTAGPLASRRCRCPWCFFSRRSQQK